MATGAVLLYQNIHRVLGTWDGAVSAYVALSEFSKELFVVGGLPRDRIHVKPNFVLEDQDIIGFPIAKADQPYALFLGRLSVEKGIESLLAAWKRLGMDYGLVIVGDGPLASAVRDAESPSIVWLGRRSNAEALQILRGASFVIVPSLCYENFALSVVEALCAGVPVLTSDQGVSASLIKDGQTGRHFAVGDADDLARKARWLINHPADLARMRANARREYTEKYAEDVNYEQLMSIYSSVLN